MAALLVFATLSHLSPGGGPWLVPSLGSGLAPSVRPSLDSSLDPGLGALPAPSLLPSPSSFLAAALGDAGPLHLFGSPWVLLLVAVFLWLAFAAFANWVLSNPRGDAITGLAYRAMQIYAALVHRLRVEGTQHLPTCTRPGCNVHDREATHATHGTPIAHARGEDEPCSFGPLIVVCNHTAGIDPVLVQAVVPFHIRFMMASAMRLPFFETFWDWAGIISVSPSGRDLSGVREALAHLKAGGVVGIFPEGAIERPPRRLRPFMPGTSLLITKGRAPVLPIAIDGTPYTPTAWGSLVRTSRSRVRIGPLMSFPQGTPQQTIVQTLEAWFANTLEWPIEPQTSREEAVTIAALPSPVND